MDECVAQCFGCFRCFFPFHDSLELYRPHNFSHYVAWIISWHQLVRGLRSGVCAALATRRRCGSIVRSLLEQGGGVGRKQSRQVRREDWLASGGPNLLSVGSTSCGCLLGAPLKSFSHWFVLPQCLVLLSCSNLFLETQPSPALSTNGLPVSWSPQNSSQCLAAGQHQSPAFFDGHWSRTRPQPSSLSPCTWLGSGAPGGLCVECCDPSWLSRGGRRSLEVEGGKSVAERGSWKEGRTGAASM